uniref:Uncharacterized protein n=1 Tax=Arundo donax TaxID=35708 RepID=A0A0A8ZZT8_ARUDO
MFRQTKISTKTTVACQRAHPSIPPHHCQA